MLRQRQKKPPQGKKKPGRKRKSVMSGADTPDPKAELARISKIQVTNGEQEAGAKVAWMWY